MQVKFPDKAPPLVLVAWEDAKNTDDEVWVHNNTERKYVPHIFWQAGFLILDVPEGIQLTEAWHPDVVARPTQIPRGMIRSIRKLK